MTTATWTKDFDKALGNVYHLDLGVTGSATVHRNAFSRKWCGTIVKNGIGNGTKHFKTLAEAKSYYEA